MNKDTRSYYGLIAEMVKWNGGPYALYKGWVLTDRAKANVISNKLYSAWEISGGREIHRDSVEELLMEVDNAST